MYGWGCHRVFIENADGVFSGSSSIVYYFSSKKFVEEITMIVFHM